MAIHLTGEHERRIQAVISRGVYDSVEEVVEAVAAMEQRIVPGFSGTQEELEALLAEGLASPEMTDDEFWNSVDRKTDALFAKYKADRRS